MALTVVLGLALLSVANYGNAFEFSGLDPSVQSKTQLKPTIKPFSSFTNQPQDQVKSSFGFKNVAAKPFGSPFDSFKQSYQSYQPSSPFRANYQPFGPYPGYPGPVVYPGQGGYPGPAAYSGPASYPAPSAFPGPAAYPVPSHHFDDSIQRQFGFPQFQQYPVPATQQSFNPFKFGSTKKFNKNVPGLAEINVPGKYFQEHQFGAYHGPEFTSAIVPAEHNIKQSRPKDTLIGKPIIPNLAELGLPKQNVYGFAPPPPAFKYPLPTFQPSQSFFNTVPALKSVSTTASTPQFVTTAAVDLKSDVVAVTTEAAPSSQDESATSQQVTGEASATVTPAADPQPASPSQEEVTTEVAANNEVPAAEDNTAAKEQSEQSNPTEATEPGAAVQENDSQVPAVKDFSPVVVEELKETSAAPAAEKSAEIKETPARIESSTIANLPGLPNELFAPIGDAPVPVPSYLGSAGAYPYFGQVAGDFQQPPYFANYEPPKFTEEDLKRFEADFKNGVLQQFQAFGGADVKFAEPIDAGAVVVSSTESGAAAASGTGSPAVESAGDKAESNENAEGAGEKKDAAVEPESRSSALPAGELKKSNTVQIVQEDPFNGQFPLLFDPSNTGTPLDSYRFYSHPSVASLSSRASVATYSPEDAFANFGGQFRQGYLVEGAPSLTPVTKTVVQTSQIPISISSRDHPLHSQVFKFSQSFVPYPVSGGNNAAVFRSFEVPSSTASDADASPTAAADSAATSTTEAAAVENTSSTETTA